MKKQLPAAILLSMLLGGCGFQSGMNLSKWMKILQVKPSVYRIVMKEIIPTCQKQTQTEQDMFVISASK
nr:hypothetical protein [Bacillus pumilus]